MSGINTSYLQGYESSIVGIINGILVPLLIAVAFIVFLWGVYNYFIAGAANPDKRQEGTQFVLYGVIGLVIIFSVWGLVQIFQGTLGLSAGTMPAYPTLGTPSSNAVNAATGAVTGAAATVPAGATVTGYTATGQPIYSAPAGTTIPGYVITGTTATGQPIYSPASATGSGSGGNDGTVGQGGNCENNAQACSSGYICQVNNNGNDTCVSATSATGQIACDTGSVPAGTQCAKCSNGETADTGTDCPTGSSVVVPQDNSLAAGGDCEENINACQSGLICQQIANGDDTCVSPNSSPGDGTLGAGGDCEQNANACSSGYSCQQNANGDDTCVASGGATGQIACDAGSVPAGQSCVSCWDGSTADTAGDCPANPN